jgi:predicted RNase H-like HicB family nuclease
MGQEEIRFTIEYEQEEDGRWLAEVIGLPGVLAYGKTIEQAITHAQALGLRVIADRIEHDETPPALFNISFATVAE